MAFFDKLSDAWYKHRQTMKNRDEMLNSMINDLKRPILNKLSSLNMSQLIDELSHSKSRTYTLHVWSSYFGQNAMDVIHDEDDCTSFNDFRERLCVLKADYSNLRLYFKAVQDERKDKNGCHVDNYLLKIDLIIKEADDETLISALDITLYI